MDSEYFARSDRQGITWSIQVQGRFLNTYSADNILFGNTFDRPLKLPWGSSAALKFMHFIDPTLEHDLMSSTKPWALAPLISTMPHFTHTRISPPVDKHSCNPLSKKASSVAPPPFPPSSSMCDDTSQLHLAIPDSDSYHGSESSSDSSSLSSNSSTLSSGPSHSSVMSSSAKSNGGSIRAGKLKQTIKLAKRRRPKSLNQDLSFDTASQRRSYFGTRPHRQAIQFGPEDMITTDFCYGFLEFSPSLSLRLPGGISFDLEHYWDGQPVRFICCERKDANADDSEVPWGTVFWCVSIEMADSRYDIHENEIN